MLTSKQRAYLRSLAANADTIIMIGKGGMSEQIIKQASDAIIKRELIKGKVLESAGMTPDEAANQIAGAIHAEIVQIIGTKFVLYKRNKEEPHIELPKEKRVSYK